MNRRMVLAGSAAMMTTGMPVRHAFAEGAATNAGLPLGTREEAVLEALPGKQKLIKLSYRPPNYESPLSAFAQPITPNDQFFVRYHLSQIPTVEDLANWKLTVDGDAAGKPISLTVDDLRHLPQIEVTAVCQCSGNRRGLSMPHVAGVQWGPGAMGSASWKGPRLGDVLALAGIGANAVEIGLRGADGPLLEATPAFAKSIPVHRATDPNTIIALTMNEAPLPIWNGYPARIIVPGWTATYWMKHIVHISINSQKLDNFWMKSAYRVPTGMFPGSDFPTQDNATNRPITDIVLNALATSQADGDVVRGAGFTLAGMAWDNGTGIARVDVSPNGGETWGVAMLGKADGPFAFQPWSIQLTASPGPLMVLIRATSKTGAVQPEKAIFNAAGYHNNAIQRLSLTAA